MQLFITLIIAIGLTLLLSLLYSQTHSIDAEENRQVIENLRKIKQKNALVNAEIYRAYSDAVQHYDDLEGALAEMNNLFGSLRAGIDNAYADRNTEFKAALNELERIINEKVSLVDSFKNIHATLKISLDYFPTIAVEMERNVKDVKLLNETKQLIRALSFYSVNNHQVWHAESLTAMQNLRNSIGQNKSGHVQIENLLRHADHLLRARADIVELFRSESMLSLEGQIETVSVMHERHLKRLELRAEYYRLGQYILSVTLVLIIAYILVLLSRNAIALSREKERAQVTLASISNGVVVTDVHGITKFINPAGSRLIGCSKEQAAGLPIETLLPLHDDIGNDVVENCVRLCLRDGNVCEQQGHAMLTTHDGRIIAITHSASPIRDQNGTLLGVVMVFDNVTETRRLTRELEWRATHDALTGLVNRREFSANLSAALELAGRDNKNHTLLYMDLDQFKVINDTCGHAAGDELLKQVVSVIQAQIRSDDVLARLGGDEFALLLPHCDVNCGIRIAENILDNLQKFRFNWNDKVFTIGVSIGLVPLDAHCGNEEAVLSAADVACYAAKDSGRNRMHIYTSVDEDLMHRRDEMMWVSGIVEALRADRFELFYQAITPVNTAQSHEDIRGVMLRILGNDAASPRDFLVAAERYNLMPNIDRWVIRHAFRELGMCKHGTNQQTLLMIHLSGASLADKKLPEFIMEEARLAGIQPQQICFEINETSATANLNRAIGFMTPLRDAGFRFALDNFGAGISSFSYLRNLPVDFIKIDGNLIVEIVANPVFRAIVEMINRIGHLMQVKTIAEHVENEAILREIRTIGIDYAQGYVTEMPQALPKPMQAS